MSKPLNADLYGDIYADEFQEFLDSEGIDPPSTSTDPKASEPGSASPNPQALEDATDGEPATKQANDAGASDSATLGSLSYSAQIAQQFSSYKQHPSQERQPRAIQQHTPIQLSHTSTPGSSDSVFGKKPSEMHDAGKMFVGGLSWDTTDEGLKRYFEQFGKVDAVTIMRDSNTGVSRGFAFFTFENPNCVEAVLKQSHTLDGKSIDPKRAIPREEHLRNTRFFVGGLAPDTTTEGMRSFFSEYGKVVDTTVMLDRETGRSKGFGFVTFEDVGTSLDHIVGKGLVLDGKEIEIKPAQARSQREQTRNLVNKINNSNTRESTPDKAQQPIPQLFPGTMAGWNPLYNRMPQMQALLMNRNNMPALGNNLLMGMNPMMAMGMGGQAGMNLMAGMAGMPNMNMMMMGGMNGMGANPNLNAMNNMANMRMNPQSGMMGLGQMQNPNMGGNAGKPGVQSSIGPSRVNGVRKQPGFHPYSR
ncbi:RNA-binding domain-containing protein [Coprinopsis marcescibilis]|uniref:RNA-binding domain-containing protein n=1 Tax=Coprinopsis marcescibilis TaxID=230819 RepID=A0A5C3KJR9_COPMA|nr:RNA-binding domain-containing protein [Coprinopsis marcescibilis]